MRRGMLVAAGLTFLCGGSVLRAQQLQPTGVTQNGQGTPDDSVRGKADGRATPSGVHWFAWGVGGFASGVVVPLLGPIGAVAVAEKRGVALPAGRESAIANQSPAYRGAYTAAYDGKVRSRRKIAAAVGGVL